MENKYFTELARRLNKYEISTGTPDSGKLPILLEGREIGIVVPGGGLRVRKESLDEPVASELYHLAGTIAAEVHEYMDLMKNVPPLNAVSLSDSYKLLADFNGYVLPLTDLQVFLSNADCPSVETLNALAEEV